MDLVFENASKAACSYDDEDTKLAEAGINPEELEFMAASERREILEAAGLDPDEYDF